MNKAWMFLLVGAVGAAGAAAFFSTPAANRAAAESGGTSPGEVDPGAPRLQSGHPPMGAGDPASQADQLPPGHPPTGMGSPAGDQLPPGHPPIDDPSAMTKGAMPDDHPSNDGPLAWKVPGSCAKVPNPNSMRLETYRCPAGAKEGDFAELAVSRAGGGAESNVERWIGQFESPVGAPRREKRSIAGFDVWVVQVQGTYLAGSMGGGDAKKPGWALLGAVVGTPDTLTFFKMTGPAAAVEKSRAAFEATLKSFTKKG
jgi:hypothetical protein